jgi:hypothetical protein
LRKHINDARCGRSSIAELKSPFAKDLNNHGTESPRNEDVAPHLMGRRIISQDEGRWPSIAAPAASLSSGGCPAAMMASPYRATIIWNL